MALLESTIWDRYPNILYSIITHYDVRQSVEDKSVAGKVAVKDIPGFVF